jgi:hypothetical protein
MINGYLHRIKARLTVCESRDTCRQLSSSAGNFLAVGQITRAWQKTLINRITDNTI